MLEKQINWLIKKSNDKLTKEELVWGLVLGLVGGLVLGLVRGLVWGLVLGLVLGLVWGLVLGLVWGLGSLLSVNIIALFKYPPLINFMAPLWLHILLTILIIFVIMESIFLFEKNKPKKKENIYWFTAKRKGIDLLKSLFVYVEVIGFIKLIKKGVPYLVKYHAVIIKWVGYIGMGILCLAVLLGVLFVYIKINSLKYKR